APVRVDHAGPLVARPDPVLPVVVVGEAPAGPAQVRDADRAERVDDVAPDAAHVRHVGVLPDPEAAVDAASEVLGEVSVDVAGDGRSGQVEVDDGGDRGHGFSWWSAVAREEGVFRARGNPAGRTT